MAFYTTDVGIGKTTQNTIPESVQTSSARGTRPAEGRIQGKAWYPQN